MKKTMLIILSLFLCVSVQAQDIQTLYNNRDFIRLSQLDIEKWDLQQLPSPLLKAQVYHAMTRYEESNKEIELLLQIDSIAQNAELMLEILLLQGSNYSANYQYKQEAECYKKILDNYGDLLGDALVFFQDAYRRYDALSGVKPVQVAIPHDTKIPTKPDKKGLPLVQVRTPKDSISLIFDTGAGFSCVSKSVAEKLGIQTVADSMIVGGAAGNFEFMSIGVADTLYVGDIVYTNVVFGILEDEKLTFPEHDYAANGAIGFPEMKLLPAIKIHKNGILEISTNEKKQRSNMMFTESNQIIVQANDSLLLQLDTGAAGSDMSVKYYNKQKEQIDKTATLTTRTLNGMGGSKEFSAYYLQNFPITIDSITTILHGITVSIQPIMRDEFDGFIGQDVISQYDYMLLDFKNMHFSLGNNQSRNEK
jgi:predicted aspartyl protease